MKWRLFHQSGWSGSPIPLMKKIEIGGETEYPVGQPDLYAAD
jgi:hypothetical protein